MTQPTRIYKHSSAGTDWAALAGSFDGNCDDGWWSGVCAVVWAAWIGRLSTLCSDSR